MPSIKHLNKSASLKKNKPDEILASLEIKSGQIVAEIGVGGGYFIEKLADFVGETGKVFGIDIEMLFLDNIKTLNSKFSKQVIFPVIVVNDDFSAITEKLDIIFTRNTYHHLSNRIEYFRKIKDKLSVNGRVAIIDYNQKSFMKFFGHGTAKNTVIDEMTKAGYNLLHDLDILKRQSFLIFSNEKA